MHRLPPSSLTSLLTRSRLRRRISQIQAALPPRLPLSTSPLTSVPSGLSPQCLQACLNPRHRLPLTPRASPPSSPLPSTHERCLYLDPIPFPGATPSAGDEAEVDAAIAAASPTFTQDRQHPCDALTVSYEESTTALGELVPGTDDSVMYSCARRERLHVMSSTFTRVPWVMSATTRRPASMVRR